MDNEQAKCILRACRDTDEPLVAEALEFARRDPALARWLEQERALDAAIADKLRSLPTPAGLKASILAAAKAAPLPVRTSRRTILTAAALIVLIAVGLAIWLPILTWRADSFTAFQVDMSGFLSERFRLQFPSSDLAEMQGWLAAKHEIKDYRVPLSLAARAKPAGCRVLDWNGRKVGLLCFYTPDGKVVHFVVIDRADLPDAPIATQPEFARRGNWTSATWSSGDKVYFVMSPLDEARLRSLL